MKAPNAEKITIPAGITVDDIVNALADLLAQAIDEKKTQAEADALGDTLSGGLK